MRSLPRFLIVLIALACGVVSANSELRKAPTSKIPAAKTPAAKPVEDDIKDPWPTLSDEEQTAAIAEMKKFADDAAGKFDPPLKLKVIETKYFLLSSDLPAKEAQNWAGLLDRMYVRLAELFGVPKGQNIWRGKAMIFVFSHQGDFVHFENTNYGSVPPFVIGLCHQSSNGNVVVAFFRQPDELEFAHVLVHESVHGFIHRFRTPVRVPSWANEGLAETIATELVPQPGRPERVKANAREGLSEHGGHLGDFFTAEHIGPWQYPVAETMCTFMISQNKKGYVDFIKGIKNGLDTDEALSTKYKAPRERIVPVYGKSIGVQHVD